MKKHLVLALALLLPFAMQAQTRADDSPETVVARMNTALEQQDWQAAAREFDPAALKEVRDLLSAILAAAPKAQQQQIATVMFKNASLDTLEKMDDASFFAAYLGGVMSASGGTVGRSQIIGSVAEGDDQVHVLTRSQVQSPQLEFSKMDVVSLRRHADGWWVQLKGDMKGLLEATKKRSEARN